MAGKKGQKTSIENAKRKWFYYKKEIIQMAGKLLASIQRTDTEQLQISISKFLNLNSVSPNFWKLIFIIYLFINSI